MVGAMELWGKAGRAVRQGALGLGLLSWAVLPSLGGGDGGLCLSSPISLVCPTCPVPLRCYAADEWFDFFFPSWDALL